MNYSVAQLTTTEDCDTVLFLIEKKVKDLSFKKLSLERRQESYAANTLEVSSELAIIDSELNAVNLIMSSLPEGPSKSEHLVKQKKLEYHRVLLLNRKEDYGVIALLTKEFDIACTEKELVEAEAFLAAIEARKAAL